MTLARIKRIQERRYGRLVEIGLFLASGGLAALVNLVSRYILTPSLGFELSVVVAYLIGMVAAYVLFRAVVFGRTGDGVRRESYRFVIVNIVALCVVWIVSVGLVHFVFPMTGITQFDTEIAHVIAVCVPAVTSYVGHSRYTFRRS